jgi:hypothetical protein
MPRDNPDAAAVAAVLTSLGAAGIIITNSLAMSGLLGGKSELTSYQVATGFAPLMLVGAPLWISGRVPASDVDAAAHRGDLLDPGMGAAGIVFVAAGANTAVFTALALAQEKNSEGAPNFSALAVGLPVSLCASVMVAAGIPLISVGFSRVEPDEDAIPDVIVGAGGGALRWRF